MTYDRLGYAAALAELLANSDNPQGDALAIVLADANCRAFGVNVPDAATSQ